MKISVRVATLMVCAIGALLMVAAFTAQAGWNNVTYYGNGNTGGEPPVDPNNPYKNGNTVTVLGPNRSCAVMGG